MKKGFCVFLLLLPLLNECFADGTLLICHTALTQDPQVSQLILTWTAQTSASVEIIGPKKEHKDTCIFKISMDSSPLTKIKVKSLQFISCESSPKPDWNLREDGFLRLEYDSDFNLEKAQLFLLKNQQPQNCDVTSFDKSILK